MLNESGKLFDSVQLTSEQGRIKVPAPKQSARTGATKVARPINKTHPIKRAKYRFKTTLGSYEIIPQPLLKIDLTTLQNDTFLTKPDTKWHLKDPLSIN